MKSKTLIIITGPTASGKTSIAIDTALRFKTSIISADSRQCYRELNVGVAKPTLRQLELVKHYFVNTHSIHEEVNAATFARYAGSALDEIFSSHEVAVMAGGTGMYIKALTEGLDEIPEIPKSLRDGIRQEYRLKGLPWLQEQVSIHDPLYYSSGETGNPQRMMRALEVKLATGSSIRHFQTNKKVISDGYKVVKYAVDLTREQLYSNINRRVDEMMNEGLEDEARGLLPFRTLNALQTVGYTELFEYFDNKCSLAEAVEKIKQHTRNYAKRQLTWFRKDEEIRWIKRGQEITA